MQPLDSYHEQGSQARLDGGGVTACPHPDGTLAATGWVPGWVGEARTCGTDRFPLARSGLPCYPVPDSRVKPMGTSGNSVPYRYVARFWLDASAETPSTINFHSMDDLADWISWNSMCRGQVRRGTNFFEVRNTDGSPLSQDELLRLPDRRLAPVIGRTAVWLGNPEGI